MSGSPTSDTLADPIYCRAAFNSFVLTVGAVAAKFVIGLAGAIVLHQRFPLRGLFRALVFLPWAVPGLIAGAVLEMALRRDGRRARLPRARQRDRRAGRSTCCPIPPIAMFSIGVAMVWHGLPFFIMMFLAGLSAVPDELYEAAAIDGAGPVAAVLARHAAAAPRHHRHHGDAVAIWTFNSFHMVFILTNGGPAMRTQILPTLAYEYGIGRSQLGLGVVGPGLGHAGLHRPHLLPDAAHAARRD